MVIICIATAVFCSSRLSKIPSRRLLTFRENFYFEPLTNFAPVQIPCSSFKKAHGLWNISKGERLLCIFKGVPLGHIWKHKGAGDNYGVIVPVYECLWRLNYLRKFLTSSAYPCFFCVAVVFIERVECPVNVFSAVCLSKNLSTFSFDKQIIIDRTWVVVPF